MLYHMRPIGGQTLSRGQGDPVKAHPKSPPNFFGQVSLAQVKIGSILRLSQQPHLLFCVTSLRGTEAWECGSVVALGFYYEACSPESKIYRRLTDSILKERNLPEEVPLYTINEPFELVPLGTVSQDRSRISLS